MPELAELKLTADYVNLNSKGITYVNVEKNPEHKGENLEIPFKYFNILAESQGKEIVMTIKEVILPHTIPDYKKRIFQKKISQKFFGAYFVLGTVPPLYPLKSR